MSRMRRLKGSTPIQLPAMDKCTAGPPWMTKKVSTRWARPQTGSSSGRNRSEGRQKAARPPSKGKRRSAAIMLFPQGRKLTDVHAGKFPVDLVHDNTHDKNRDQQVEEHPGFHHQGHGLGQQHAENENPVFKNQVAESLGDGLAPGNKHEKTGGQGGQADRDKKRAVMHLDKRQPVAEDKRPGRGQGAEEQGRDITDQRLHLPLDLYLADSPEQQKRDGQPFEQERSPGQNQGMAGKPVEKKGQQREDTSLDGHGPDAGAQGAAPQQKEVEEDDQQQQQIGGGVVVHYFLTLRAGSARKTKAAWCRPAAGA